MHGIVIAMFSVSACLSVCYSNNSIILETSSIDQSTLNEYSFCWQ